MFGCLAENNSDGFDLIEPSLIQQLKKILDQYPDDGQILKVRTYCIYMLLEPTARVEVEQFLCVPSSKLIPHIHCRARGLINPQS